MNISENRGRREIAAIYARDSSWYDDECMTPAMLVVSQCHALRTTM
jgi:hypothetical protein